MASTKIIDLFNPDKNKATKFSNVKAGEIGYDNIRENIDPHVKTQAVSTSEGTVQNTPSDSKDITNKEYVDSQIAGENHWDLTGNQPNQYVETFVDNTIISGAALAISGSSLVFDKDTGSVGIGTTSATDKLIVKGQIATEHATSTDRLIVLSSAADDGVLNINANTVNKVKLHANGDSFFNGGNVGIGTDSPDRRFHIMESDAFLSPASANTAFILEENDDTNIEIMTPTDKAGGIIFSDGANQGGIRYRHNNDDLVIRSGGNDVVFVDSAGQVGIGTSQPQALLEVSGGNVKVIGTGQTEFVAESEGNSDVQQKYINPNNSWTTGLDQSNTQAYTVALGEGFSVPKIELDVSGNFTIHNRTAEPAPPTNAGTLLVSGGALFFLGGSGTLTEVASA
jgi:hypothetical protein